MRISSVAMLMLASVLHAGQLDWFVYRKLPGAEVVVEKEPATEREAIRFQYRRGDSGHALIIANLEPALKVTAQHKLTFWMRGEKGNGGAQLGVMLSVPSRKKSYCPGPSVATTSARWRRHVLNLNTDFGLPDAVHTVSQIKFGLGVKALNEGDLARVWIRDVAIVEAGDLSLGGAGRDFVVTEVFRPVAPSIDLPVVRVFSDMDNEDRTTRIHSPKHSAGIPEPVSGPGYRHLLTLPLDAQITQVDSLGERPDVTVVCRPVAGTTEPEAINAWVESGGALLLYGACAGYGSLLPGKLALLPHGAKRQGFSIGKPGHSLFAGIRWRKGITLVPFGTFEPNAQATVLASFDDGTPAMVAMARGKGQVLFLNFGPGKSLTDAQELYDELALRALYWLAGHPDSALALPEIDRRLTDERRNREKSIVRGTLAAAGIRSSAGWRLGMSEDNVGRFGWAIDEGLLVGNVNRHLQLTCGDTSLGFAFPSKPASKDSGEVGAYAVPALNWVCKTAQATVDGQRLTMRQSMLTPFVHYETEEPVVRLTFGHAPTHASFPTKGGVVARALDHPNALSDFARTATAGWLLVWEAGVSHPLLLVFEKRLGFFVEVADGAAMALVLRAPEHVGTFLAGHPFGVERVDSTGWLTGVPRAAAKRTAFWHRAALAFPVGCDEVFRLDRAAGRVRIANRFRYLVVEDAWGTRPKKLAVLPPLIGYALDRNLLVADCSRVRDTGLPTKYGMLKVVEDSEALAYSLPMAPEERFAYVNSADEPDLSAYINRQFENGVRWSCGGHVPYEDWKVEQSRQGLNYRNIDPFSWSFGLATALQGRVFLNDANREKLAERASRRFSDPIERHQYKTFARYREEPFSGTRYPVLFNSFYPNKTRYAGTFGSRVIYGDENEASTLTLMLGYLHAVQLGNAGLVRANWSYFKQAARMMLTTDDWAAHASGCREYSAGAWLDMLNCEYPGMVYYARVAEIAGDTAAAEQGYYRAAKRMLPTLMRLSFHEYANRYRLAPFEARVVFGFNEPDGPLAAKAHLDGFNCAGAMDLTDFSQATCFPLLALYATYAPETVQEYLDEVVRPSFLQNGKWSFHFPYVKAFAFLGASSDDLRKMVGDVDELRGERARNDWPGMRQCDEVGAAIFRLRPDVYVASHAPAALLDAIYADADGRVELTLEAPEEDTLLKLVCRRPILDVACNGRDVPKRRWTHQGELFTVSLPKGRSQWLLRLGTGTVQPEAPKQRLWGWRGTRRQAKGLFPARP
jgi:hypothetical protein